jgi:hypothetical protein
MKNYKDIVVEGKKKKNGKTFNWIYTFTLDGSTLGSKTCSMKQSRLEALAFNFCLENGFYSLIHKSTF